MKITATILFLLFFTSQVLANEIVIQYQNLPSNEHSINPNANIVITNASGDDIVLSHIHLQYEPTYDGVAGIDKPAHRSAMLDEADSKLGGGIEAFNTGDVLSVHFKDSETTLGKNETIIVRLSAFRASDSLFDQAIDFSNLEEATGLSSTTQVTVTKYSSATIYGIPESSEARIVNAQLFAEVGSVNSNSKSQVEVAVKEEKRLDIKVANESYSDYFEHYAIGEVLSTYTSSPKETRARLIRYNAMKYIDPYNGGEVSTANGVILEFPPTLSYTSDIDITLTSLASNQNVLLDTNLYKGIGITVGNTPLQFLSSIDVFAIDLDARERTHLTNYNPAIVVHIPTNCNNEIYAPVSVWYLNEDTGVWQEHDQKAIFRPRMPSGYCYFTFTTDHF